MPHTRAKKVKTRNADCIPPFWLDVKALQRALLETGFYLGDHVARLGELGLLGAPAAPT
jgi:hypothetical protein